MESGNGSNDDSIMPPLLSEEKMDTMYSSAESDDEPMSAEILEDICDGISSDPNVNRREVSYIVHDCIRQRI